ncbi:MAG TPA: FAD-dependent oxidoreductase [Alphaproteobacteria bacterium]|nr:FAD-dependent oxidoreductase [Alphaproteobacteria bacterium]
MTETYIIIGAAQAGGWAAKTLRDQGFAGRVVLIGDEPYPPHERPPLSKDVLLGLKPPESTHLWPPEKLAGIELKLGVRAERIDRAARQVVLATGETLTYDRLLIATGSRVRRLNTPGADLKGVHYLRTIDDTLAIKRDLGPQTHLIVVGGGWIGLETAAAARKHGAQVTVVEMAGQLCNRALPRGLADYLQARHESQGVTIRLSTTVARFEGAGKVERAVLDNGQTVPASLVVVGIGVVPNAELAQAAGLAVDNGIVTDACGRTEDPLVFAAGDVTNHANEFLRRRVRLESWANAQNQAIAAAKAMLGKKEPYVEIPWFWSDQYNLNLQLLGIPHKTDTSIVRGDRAKDQFLEFFLANGTIEAVAAVNSPRDLRFAKRLMQIDKPIDPARLADMAVTLQDLAKG